MKKIMSFLLCLLLCAALCACAKTESPSQTPEPTPSTEPVIFNKEDGKLYTEVYYNPNGMKYASVIYAYDGSGNVVSETKLGLNDAEEGILRHEYYPNGSLSLSVFDQCAADGTYSEQYRLVYAYDENGYLSAETRTEGGVTVAVTSYDYDILGRVVKESRFEGEDFCIAEYDYAYDANGRMVSCRRSDYIEENSSENNYGYDAKGRLLTDQCYDESGNLLSRTEYTYDDNGNEVKRSVYTEGGELVSCTEKTYEYDDIGNIISCVTTHSDGTPGTTVKYTWQYSKG